MEDLKNKKVLVSGASFAGLSTAYWMNKLGYEVTVVEIANGLKKGGTPVNIMGSTIEVVKSMGIFDQILSKRITMELIEFKNSNDVTERAELVQEDHIQKGEEEYEVERDFLLHLMYDLIKDDAEFIFGESIASITDNGELVSVKLKRGQELSVDLV
jgi:2-polyprenyl-6-methoxyphenol hydroxylase-like FAD-dependent oxidoreductase